MSQKVKIQDGVISYSASDPSLLLDFGVAGNMSVTNQLNVGSINTPEAGVISVPPGTSMNRGKLDITTGAHNTLNIYENSVDGGLYINNVKWPSALSVTHPGMFLGISAINQLTYYPFILGYTASDTLSDAALNVLYPTAQIGQNVVGPTLLYYSIGTGMWRRLSDTGAPPSTSLINKSIYTTTTTTPGQVIDSVSMLDYGAITYRIAIASSTSRQYTEVRILHDSTNVYINEINTLTSGPILATFTADISGPNMRLLSNPLNANTVYTLVTIGI